MSEMVERLAQVLYAGIDLSRRRLLTAGLGLAAAPFIVKASSLMKLVALKPIIVDDPLNEVCRLLSASNEILEDLPWVEYPVTYRASVPAGVWKTYAYAPS